MVKKLIFDVSNNYSSVALIDDEEIVSVIEDLRLSMQSEQIITIFEMILKENNIDYRDLDYVITTSGPGSFTGIKIGVAIAKMLKMLLPNTQVICIDNFILPFLKLRDQVSSFDKAIIVLDAYRGQAYTKEFDYYGNLVGDAKLVDNNKLIQNIIFEASSCVLAVAGSAVAELYPEIINSGAKIFPRFSKIRSYHIARYAKYILEKGLLSDELLPLYIRPPDAKIPSK